MDFEDDFLGRRAMNDDTGYALPRAVRRRWSGVSWTQVHHSWYHAYRLRCGAGEGEVTHWLWPAMPLSAGRMRT
jgi:hypothetical protein